MATSRFLPICLLAALSACSPEALPFRNPLDRLGVEVENLGLIGNFWPCGYGTVSDGSTLIETLDWDDCYRFDRPTRMRGVWLVALEDSEFLPGATTAPKVRDLLARDKVFLDGWPEAHSSLPPALEGEDVRSPAAYAIEFIGRRSSYPGEYGMAGEPSMVIVDRLLSARAIKPPPPPDFEAFKREVLRRRARQRSIRPPPALPRSLPICFDILCPTPRQPDETFPPPA